MSIFDDIVERLEDVTHYQGYIFSNCPHPNHVDSKPSFCVWEDEDKPEGSGRFKCLGCDFSGTHKYLWKFLTGAEARIIAPNMKQEKKFLPQWKKWEEQYGSIENLVQKAHDNVTLFPDTHAWYINKRKLQDVYEPCMLGCKDGWVFFPIFDQQGKVIDVIVRDTSGKTKYIIRPNDEETPLLFVPNWKRVMSSKVVYVVYGLIDALALEMCGLPCVSGSTGKSLSEKRLIQLNKKWIIIPDKNEDDAARKLAKSLGNFTHLIRLPYDDEVKDPDGYRMKHGLDKLKSLILNDGKL